MPRWYSDAQVRHLTLPVIAYLIPHHFAQTQPKEPTMKIYNYAGRNWIAQRQDGDTTILVPCEEDGTPTGEDHCVRMPQERVENLRRADFKTSGEAKDATRRQG